LYQQFNKGELKEGVVKDKYAYVASFDEIEGNEFNLNIPRYVDTFEEEKEIDLNAVKKRILGLEKELSNIQLQMEKYLIELEIN